LEGKYGEILDIQFENMTRQDWVLLTLRIFGGYESQRKFGRIYYQELLEQGGIHVGVATMLYVGDSDGAGEVFMAHKRYLGASRRGPRIYRCYPNPWFSLARINRGWLLGYTQDKCPTDIQREKKEKKTKQRERRAAHET
jgi:hypothetical protein